MTAAPSRGCLIRNERGSSSLELVIIVPALVLMLGLMVAGGRLWFARATVAEAAQASARAASLARGPDQAATDGQAAGRASMETAGLECRDQFISVETGAFAVPVGTPATVTSTVVCHVPFSDLLLPGMPGSIDLTSTESSALDTYRSR